MRNETNNNGRDRDLSRNRGGIRHPLTSQYTERKPGTEVKTT
jgi:hypothetical protein